jgi:uncharacterized membrane protein YfcA
MMFQSIKSVPPAGRNIFLSLYTQTGHFQIKIKIQRAAHNKQMKKKMDKRLWLKLGCIGAAGGFMNGFLGSGGGILVLLGLLAMGMEQKKAHASSLMVILPISAVSVMVYASGGFLNGGDNAALLIGSAAGGILGALALSRISSRVLEWVFTALILISGVRMLWQS